MKIMRSLVFLLVIYVLFCNNTNAEAASKAKEAKIAYANIYSWYVLWMKIYFG